MKNILICLLFLFFVTGCSDRDSNMWNSIVEDSKSSNVFKIDGQGKYIVKKDDNSVWIYFDNDVNWTQTFTSKIMIFPPTK